MLVKAVKYLIRLSNTTGIAMGNIYNSGHCGAMSYFGFDNDKWLFNWSE